MADRKIAITLFFFFLVSSLTAQQTGSGVSGTIVDKVSKKPVEFANVELLNTTDSSAVKGTVTDNKGKFSLDQVKTGKYLLRYSFIGYEKKWVLVTVDKARINLG